jgi:hypothetical protein
VSASVPAAHRQSAPLRRSSGYLILLRLLLGALAALPCTTTSAWADPNAISVELNKLEPQQNGCRAYVVVTNKNATEYQVLKLDLVLFQPDGVIGRRFAVDLGPLKPDKRSVKLFDIDNARCDQIGSFLINDVLECKAGQESKSDCLANIAPSSLTKVQLNK